MKSIAVAVFLACAFFGYSQNSLHWKNRKPHEGYWQQDVSYEIEATLDDEAEKVSGKLKLTYTNNSPDDLTQLYFHVYQNAFEPGSYKNLYSGVHNEETDPHQHTEVSALIVDGQSYDFIKDNTILIVDLKSPLKSGATATITCDFVTQFGPDNGRMKSYSQFGYKHFNVVHWYPRISVYDRKFGWTTDQHLGHEFYGDYGTYRVELTLPEQYILDGTGRMTNRDETLPPSLMTKLDIKNFKNKPWNEAPSEVISKSGKTKVWKFEAENVHDFAWTADPTYRIGTAAAKLENGREILCVALAQEQHASGWQNAAEYNARIIELYSRDFGEYHYPKMIVADARDGMEYPMLTLDGGSDPGYRSLLAHEIGHNWFYGMVGNNETYRASLDEGFTQFLTSWAMTELEGDSVGVGTPLFSLKKSYEQKVAQRDVSVYAGYYYSSVIYDNDPQLNTHSDKFDDRRQYGQVYSKTGVMLYNLQYVLGDSLFLAAMQHYFNQWKFCHPYFEDFRASIIQFTGVDLNWFFDQWLETDKKIDYSIRSFKKAGENKYELKLKRKGEMEMPLEISLIAKDGSEEKFWIPNTYYTKKTDATVLPKWMSWGEYNTTYEAIIETEADVKEVRIDASNRLADINYLNNSTPTPIHVKLDNLSRSYPSRKYEVEWLPSLWYNGYDGLKLGVIAHGSYFNKLHQIDAGIWFNSGIGQQGSILEYSALESDFYRFNYRIEYETPMRGIAKQLDLIAKSRWIDGLAWNSVGWKKALPNNKTWISQEFTSLWRPDLIGLNYLIYADLWNLDRWNNFTQLRVDHIYSYGNRSSGHIVSRLRSPFLASDYDCGYLNLESVNDNRIYKLNWRTRAFGQIGVGNNWAPESQLYAATGNPETMMDNPFTRSVGVIPVNTFGYGAATGNFQTGGGLNLRGYNNYLLPETNNDSLVRMAYAGMSGLAFNTELEFDDLVKVASRLKRYLELKTYIFADAGVININRPRETFGLSSLRADAGVGLALEIKQWGRYSDLRPTTIRADLPLFVNRPPAAEEYFQFRWLIAIDRAF
ncbi:MAG: M1 family metallopeptidase [Flavobacteriales bacterium]